ncbi:unnamed protein product [Gordionus sp. m RMFG-2023]
MSLCGRYLCSENDEVQIKEDFLQFIPIQDMRGECLDVHLKKININVNFMRGQGYDGASAMSGHLNGVQSHLIKKYPTAIYVHCASHSLNLSISDCCSIPVIRSTMGTIGKVYDMFKLNGLALLNINRELTPDNTEIINELSNSKRKLDITL